MGCCESREKDEQKKADLAHLLHDEFLMSRTLVREGYHMHTLTGQEATELGHFAHSFQMNSDANIRDVYDIPKSSKSLGEGMLGTVRQGIHRKSKAVRAVKSVNTKTMDQRALRALRDEVGIMRMLDHPHIIKLYEVYHDKNNVLYLVEELCTGGDLLDRTAELCDPKSPQSVHGFDENRVADWMKQLLGAVYYCHKHRIVHRDLKPENLMLEDKAPDAQIKLIDFGIAAVLKEGEYLNQRVGTPAYVAPEVYDRKYVHKVDIWSCGVICYVLLTGTPCFEGHTEKETKYNIRHLQYKPLTAHVPGISEAVQKFVKSFLILNPDERPEASELLKDDWIQKKCDSKKVPLNASILKNIETYNRSRNLKKLTLSLIATQAQHEEVEDLRKLFESLDTDGDGELSREELEAGLATAKLDAVDIETLMQMDTDESGFIDWSEFIAASLDRKKFESRDILQRAFFHLDQDGSGTISKDELGQMLAVGTGVLDDEHLQKLMEEADQDGDGEISFEEFEKMMTKS